MKCYVGIVSAVLVVGLLVGCAPMQASVPQQTATIGGMQSTPNNPIERNSFVTPSPTPIENANKMISY